MAEPLPPETLAWLRQTAKFEGGVTAQAVVHLLERMDALDALEARDTEDASRWASVRQSIHRLRERIEALEQRSVPGLVDLAAPTPEAAPVATNDSELEEELFELYEKHDTIIGALLSIYYLGVRRCMNTLGRQHGAAQPPAAQPVPVGIYPVEYADADGDGIRIVMEPSDETGQVCWVVRNSRRVNPLLEFPTPEAALVAHRAAQPPAAQPAQPAPPAAPYGQTAEQARRDRAGELGKAAADASIAAVLAANPPAAQPPDPQPVAAIRAALERLLKLRSSDTHALLGLDWDEAFVAARAALAQPPAAQPAPVAAPAGGLVDEICRQLAIRRGEVRAVIRLVAAWLRLRTGTIANGSQWADMIEQEADQ